MSAEQLPRRTSLAVIAFRTLVQVLLTLLLAVAATLILLFIASLLGLPEGVTNVTRWVVLIFCFFIVPPAIAQRGGWRSERMESLGCPLLFLGPIGWFILYWWREESEAERRHMQAWEQYASDHHPPKAD